MILQKEYFFVKISIIYNVGYFSLKFRPIQLPFSLVDVDENFAVMIKIILVTTDCIYL